MPKKKKRTRDEQITDKCVISVKVNTYAAEKTNLSKGNRKKWFKALKWWQEQINKNCEDVLEIDTISDNGEDEKKLSPKVKVGKRKKKEKRDYIFFRTKSGKKEGGKKQRITGGSDLQDLVQESTDNACFHLAFFKTVQAKPVGDRGGSVPGKWKVGTNVIALKRKDTSRKDRIHEMGHLFGLNDGDGFIMTKNNKKGSYGKVKFDPDWCKKIKKHLTSKSK